MRGHTDDLADTLEPMIPALRRYARALLRDPSAADDLVQDCLERAIAHWSRRRDPADTRPWVFAILHNQAMNALRRQTARGVHLALDDVDESALSARATQEDGLHYRDVLDALQILPAEQRSVLLLVSVEDLSYADAASVLDIPIGTVMSRLSRARARMLSLMPDSPAAARPALRRVK